MADQILSLLVGKLVDYIAVPVGRLFSYLHRYDENMEEFRSQLSGLETRRNDVKFRVEAAERKGEVISPGVGPWLKMVDAASDESKGFFEEENAISKPCFNGPLNLKVRYQRSRKAKKKALEFDAIKKDGTFEQISAPAPPLQIRPVNEENEFDFESRRSIFNKIMDAIKDDDVQTIGIWGMPGIGKTTLVKRAANRARDEGIFAKVAMAVVSQNPSFNSIQGQIADRIGLELTSESEAGRADQLLQRLLAMKKILIILDDIWARIELNDIGIPSGSQHKGCKIVLTSRNRGVCEEMGTRKNFTIDLLSANEALDLFMRMSGVDDRLSEKGLLAQNLSEECGGLPICIAIVARGLLDKEQHCWTDMLNRLRKSDPEEKVRDTIKLSYDNLHREEEKMFFLLCALFPEDYLISVQVLYEYGIGLDLFEKVDSADEALIRAWNLASRLKSQCLLLDEDNKNFVLKSQCLLLDEDNKNFVKMHDVIRDVALAIASEGKNTFLVRPVAQRREWTNKTTISLWIRDNQKLPDELDCPQLQILMIDCIHPDFRLHDSFFAGMKNLIVLHMSHMRFERFPQSFAALENLRTLRLSDCVLGDISAIGKLRNLVSLSFYDSNIRVLPGEVGELSNLRVLDLMSCRRLQVITPGVIQNLSQLEVLRVDRNLRWCDGEKVGHPTNASLSELIHLSHLMILEICIQNISMLHDDPLFENLTKFKVSIGKGDFPTTNISFTSSQFLNLTHLSKDELVKVGIKTLMNKTQYLKLKSISGMSIALPSHLGEYGSLKELIVIDCKDVYYVLDTTESQYEPKTPLQRLLLSNLPCLEQISKGKFPSFFVSNRSTAELFFQLKVLKLERCPELLVVFPPQATSALQNLEEICIENCDKLETLFESNDVPLTVGNEMVLFPRLLTLKLVNLPKFKAILSTASDNISQATDQRLLTHFPKLKKRELEGIDHLSPTVDPILIIKGLEAFEELMVTFLALETLNLNNLEKLKRLWHNHTSAKLFFQLKVLKLKRCPELLVVFPPQAISALQNLEEICIENCDKLETLFESNDVPLTVGNEMVLFPRLLTLKLVNVPKFKAMDQRLLTYFPKLEKLELKGIEHLSPNVDPLHIIKGLEALKELMVMDIHGKTLPQVIATLPKSRTLKLGFIRKPIESCESLNGNGGFQNLTSLNFSSCNGVKSLLTPSAISWLAHLRALFVSKCETMESIVGETSGEQNFDEDIEFSNLRILHLHDLPYLVSFYNGECALKFPYLDALSIKDCPKLKSLAAMAREMPEPNSPNLVAEALFGQQISFGRLRHLVLERLESMEEIWHHVHPVTTVSELSRLSVKGCDRLWKLFPSNLLTGLQKLESLYVESCRSLEHVLVVEDHPLLLSNMKQLTLKDLPELKQLWWNKNSCESFGLPKLCFLTISTCPGLEFIFDPSIADNLGNLLGLFVENCSSMVKIVAEQPGKKIEFPCVTAINVVNLPCFKVKQDIEFPQAQNVIIDGCFNINDTVILKHGHELVGSERYFESFVEGVSNQLKIFPWMESNSFHEESVMSIPPLPPSK